jgi:hypothetical protein
MQYIANILEHIIPLLNANTAFHKNIVKGSCLLGYNTLKDERWHPISLVMLFGLFFYTEDGGDIFLRNVSRISRDYTALYPRRQNSS